MKIFIRVFLEVFGHIVLGSLGIAFAGLMLIALVYGIDFLAEVLAAMFQWSYYLFPKELL